MAPPVPLTEAARLHNPGSPGGSASHFRVAAGMACLVLALCGAALHTAPVASSSWAAPPTATRLTPHTQGLSHGARPLPVAKAPPTRPLHARPLSGSAAAACAGPCAPDVAAALQSPTVLSSTAPVLWALASAGLLAVAYSVRPRPSHPPSRGVEDVLGPVEPHRPPFDPCGRRAVLLGALPAAAALATPPRMAFAAEDLTTAQVDNGRWAFDYPSDWEVFCVCCAGGTAVLDPSAASACVIPVAFGLMRQGCGAASPSSQGAHSTGSTTGTMRGPAAHRRWVTLDDPEPP